MQYDSPVTSAQFTTFLQSAAISSNTAEAISSVLSTTGNVNLASWDGVNAPQIPTGQTGNAQVVVAQIPGAGTDLVHVDIPASLASAKAFVFDTNASLDITFAAPAATASQARIAAAEAPATGFGLVINTGAGNDVITVKGDQNTYIDAGNGNDTIVTGNGNNTVVAGAGNNNVTTGSGNDTIILSGTGHTDIVNAGAGYDVVQLDGSASAYTFTVGNTNNVTLSGTGVQTASITDAEFLSFANGSTVALAQNDAEAAALRLFDGLLGRDADLGGAKYFTAQVDSGTSLTDIANQFLNSAELGGATTAAHINDLYSALLGRTADATGSATWEALLAKGGTLADVAANIAGSTEAQSLDQSNGAFVRELYEHVLGRDANNDQAGLNTWVSQLFNGTSRADVAKGIVGSTEAAQKADSDFISKLYVTSTGREADVSGKAYWTDVIAHGGTHADVAIGIVGSPEATAHNDNVIVLHGAV